jgi:glutathione synthase/RimK-type ligase-like ATP-grasp enzyme
VPLAVALAAAGFDAALVAWDDPAVDWDAPIPTLLRSTWNYALQLEAFLDWIDRVSTAAPLWNPPEIVRTNVRKRYLLSLALDHVPVVPTRLIKREDALAVAIEQLGSPARVVLKPEVGAGSLGTRVFQADDPAAAEHVATLAVRGPALVQPYLPSVETYGERSLIWIDGEITHSIRKTPRFSGDAEKIDGPFPIADDERAVAEAALAQVASRILYGRVDMARDDAGQPVVMELELVEPSLFFERHPPALDRYINGLCRRLERS